MSAMPGYVSRLNSCESIWENGSIVSDEEKQEIFNSLKPQPLKKHPKSFYQSCKLYMDTGASKIYYAVRKEDGREVAIKKVRLREDPETQHYVDNEGYMALLTSECPGAVKCHDCYKTKKNLWIVMDWVNGSMLKKFLKTVQLSHAHIAYVAKHILVSLDWLHSRGIAHRDIKSTNLMLDCNARLFLIDFGYTTMYTAENPISTDTVGTFLFMAPEVISGSGHTCSADIWSLGITVYEMLVGHPPLYNVPIPEIQMRMQAGEIPKLPDNVANTPLADFVGLCLQRYPGKRPTALDLLQHEFIEEACTPDEWYKFVKTAHPSWPEVLQDRLGN